MEGVALVGPGLLIELAEAIDYATGLGVGMADIPFPAIQWTSEWERYNKFGRK